MKAWDNVLAKLGLAKAVAAPKVFEPRGRSVSKSKFLAERARYVHVSKAVHDVPEELQHIFGVRIVDGGKGVTYRKENNHA